jgi:hypothetical protein
MPGITAQAAERAVFELAAEREPQIVAQRGRILREAVSEPEPLAFRDEHEPDSPC